MLEAFPIVISVPPEEAGKRLDQLLVTLLDISRARVQQLISEAKVLVNDASPKASLKLRGGERISVLGSSYGGMVAQGYVLRYPERVANLVLVCTAPAVSRYDGPVKRMGARRAPP